MFPILSRIGEMVRYMQTGLRVKHPVFLSDFKETSTDFRENLKYKMTIFGVAAELFQAEREKWRKKYTNFAIRRTGL